jgi:hypothetical protein
MATVADASSVDFLRCVVVAEVVQGYLFSR